MKRLQKWICLLLCLLFLPCFAPAEEAAPNVRVLLQRLGLTDRMDLRLGCDYLASWSGSRMLIPAGKDVSVQIRNDRLILFYQDAALDCGEKLQLSRQVTGAGSPSSPVGLSVLPWDGLYPGDLSLTVAGGQLQPVMTFNVEDYLLGVVPYEMSDDFPLEALKAQAVCARTYALSRVDPSKAWDLVDTTNDQVLRPLLSTHSRSGQAVRETAGLVVTSGGMLANCYYAASNGGQTELPAHVWSGREISTCYAVTDDPYDLENPESITKKATIRKDGKNLPEGFAALVRKAVFAQPEMKDFVQAEDAFRIDEIQSLALTTPRFPAPNRLMTRMELRVAVSGKKYLLPDTPEPLLTFEDDDEDATPTPRPTSTPVPELRLSGFLSAGVFTVELPLFPQVIRELGLSIYGADNEIITVTEKESAFLLVSGRYGHGVGMSQRGAQWMASEYGKTFRDILNFYYPGMELKKAASGAAVLPTADPVLAETPGPAATPTPRPTLMPVSASGLPEGAWLASVEGIEDDSTLNLRAEPSRAGEILMRLYKHQLLIVLETCEDPVWVHVKTDSVEGYVMVSFLEPVSSP